MRTSRFIDPDSSMMNGREIFANQSTGAATVSATPSVRCNAIRFRNELSEDQRDVRDQDRHQDESDRLGDTCARPKFSEPGPGREQFVMRRNPRK